jgi:KDO2-lipid IV(A) lauroyltransferase
LEYGVVRAFLPLPRLIPLNAIHLLSSLLGNLLYYLLPERRKIALQNLQNALGTEKTEQEIKRIARESCKSFLLTCFEIVKYQPFFKTEDAREAIKGSSGELEALFQKAKSIHEASGGCIFVTPHLGNWEFLPYVSSLVGIPLVVVVRSMKNEYLERLIYRNRANSGQVIIPKKNALFALQKTLQQGKSIGILPDQSTRQGIGVHFFGRKASTTPAPALLSIMYQKPIVVVACCRKKKGYDFDGVVSDPIWPGPFQSEKEEIFRLTEEMNKIMETIIRKYPEQYFWIHHRWKTYRSQREFLR